MFIIPQKKRLESGILLAKGTPKFVRRESRIDSKLAIETNVCVMNLISNNTQSMSTATQDPNYVEIISFLKKWLSSSHHFILNIQTITDSQNNFEFLLLGTRSVLYPNPKSAWLLFTRQSTNIAILILTWVSDHFIFCHQNIKCRRTGREKYLLTWWINTTNVIDIFRCHVIWREPQVAVTEYFSTAGHCFWDSTKLHFVSICRYRSSP